VEGTASAKAQRQEAAWQVVLQEGSQQHGGSRLSKGRVAESEVTQMEPDRRASRLCSEPVLSNAALGASMVLQELRAGGEKRAGMGMRVQGGEI
jgi:hypothetical protein